MSGTEMIAAERERQIEKEGYDEQHDSDHGSGPLLSAAIAYADAVRLRRKGQFADAEYHGWPFDPGGFKPKDDLQDLVRAGALIAAEIDLVLAGK